MARPKPGSRATGGEYGGCRGGQPYGVDVVATCAHEEAIPVMLPAADNARQYRVPGSRGLVLHAVARPVNAESLAGRIAPGTRSVSVFLVNERPPSAEAVRDEAFAFQAQLEVTGTAPFVPRPDPRGSTADDPDERVADLHYAGTPEYAAGHGIAADWELADGACRLIFTSWIPSAHVEKTETVEMPRVELGIAALGDLTDGAAAERALTPLATGYHAWIEQQHAALTDPAGEPRDTAEELLFHARSAANRIERGIRVLAQDQDALDAFRVANRAVAAALSRRLAHEGGAEPPRLSARLPVAEPPRSRRPCQSGTRVRGPAVLPDRRRQDRGVSRAGRVYHGVAAAASSGGRRPGSGRRERHHALHAAAADARSARTRRRPGVRTGAGASQGRRPVPRVAVRNRLVGGQGVHAQTDSANAATTARTPRAARSASTRTIRRASRRPFRWRAAPGAARISPRIPSRCCRTPTIPPSCVSSAPTGSTTSRGDTPLPIVAVDEPLYRRLPAFLVATVDKFASLPWVGQSGALLGGADRHDDIGFYGAAEPRRGNRLPRPLPPPNLVIQDELHLISGPLGTMAGLYEAAIEALCVREIDGRQVKPRIVASTATVRRAREQIQGLFGRPATHIFPPPGPARGDSFFARTMPASQRNAREYVGIASQGRNPKEAMRRVVLTLMGATERAWRDAGGPRNPHNPADPYMTVLGYFNSLRELGGARRILEEEVQNTLKRYGDRKRLGKAPGLFRDRSSFSDVVELTSRVSTERVAEARRRLQTTFHDRKQRVDCAIATNMISVGLDIQRLGLMLVYGQPKTNAEYIQATSRVGRDDRRPGPVVTLYNVYRPRDRSHYERFRHYHETFYRSVEVASVTPFAARALDHGFAGALVLKAVAGDQRPAVQRLVNHDLVVDVDVEHP